MECKLSSKELMNRASSIFNYLHEVVNLGVRQQRVLEGYDNLLVYSNELQQIKGVDITNDEGKDDAWLTVYRQEVSEEPNIPETLRSWVKLDDKKGNKPEFLEEVETDSVIEKFWDNDTRVEEFEKYLILWEAWAEETSLLRRQQEIFELMFRAADKLKYDGQFELIWGHGILLWNYNGREFRHPLITQRMVIEHHASKGVIQLFPDDDYETRVELGMLMNSDISNLSMLRNRFKEVYYHPAKDRSCSFILKEISAELSPDGLVISPENGNKFTCKEQLRIVDTWVIFVRKRKQDSLMRDIEAFQEKLNSRSGELPNSLSLFLCRADEIADKQCIHKVYSELDALMDTNILFPLPANSEQVQIISSVEKADGTVVLGPPGTGKSHTIANLICHYMALGKRVLVTTQKDQALRVLHDLIPVELRSLCLSLLSNNKDSRDRLESAVRRINEIVTKSIRQTVENEISIFEKCVKRYAEELNETKTRINEIAALQYRYIEDWEGKRLLPAALIRKMNKVKETHTWLNDIPVYRTNVDKTEGDNCIKLLFDTPISGNEMKELKCLRNRLEGFLIDLSFYRPKINELIDPHMFSEMALDLNTLELREDETRKCISGLIFREHDELLFNKAINELDKGIKVYKLIKEDWQRSILNGIRCESIDVKQIKRTISSLESSVKEAKKLLKNKELEDNVDTGKEFPDDELKNAVNGAMNRVMLGKKAVSLFTSAAKKKILTGITINGKFPVSANEWEKVINYLDLFQEVSHLRTRWNNLITNLGLSGVELKGNVDQREIKYEISLLVKLINELKAPVNYAKDRFPKIKDAMGKILAESDLNISDDSLTVYHETFLLIRDNKRFDKTKDRLERQKNRLANAASNDNAHPVVNEMIYLLDHRFSEHEKLCNDWETNYNKLKHLEALDTDYKRYNELINILQIKAPLWAEKCLSGEFTEEELFPEFYCDSWHYNGLNDFIKSVVKSISDIEELEVTAKRLTGFLLETKRKLVVAKTKLGLIDNTSIENLQALEEWRIALKKLGKGTGKWAWKKEKAVKFAMQKAKDAVPVWIMPLYRVSETLHAEFGSFDVVIVDEASQCDIRSLPALARGKKVIVVGDPEQISPESVGINEIKIEELIKTYLPNIESNSCYDLKTSLYDLAKIKFSGQGVLMLKEHFRCVPEIINFCNDLCYQEEIIPLRNPINNYPFEPALETLFVKSGRRDDDADINRKEAEMICERLKEMVNDLRYYGKSIGVVSLTGNEQAKYITTIIDRYLTPEQRERCKFHAGDAYAFQGDERDIIVLSMVIGSSDSRRFVALTRESYRQRFNVAVSRAKNKLILFHSVQLGDDLKNSEDLRYKLLDYMENTTAPNTNHEVVSSSVCPQNELRNDVLMELKGRGYSVVPEFKIGNVTVDLAVEGSDSRLAIECNGGLYSTYDQWKVSQTIRLQLEKAGCDIIRIWASAFALDASGTMGNLYRKLEVMGIQPNNKATIKST